LTGCSTIRCAMNSTCEPLPVARQNFQSSRAARWYWWIVSSTAYASISPAGWRSTVLATCSTSLRRSSRAPAARSSSRSASEHRPASGSDARCGRGGEQPRRSPRSASDAAATRPHRERVVGPAKLVQPYGGAAVAAPGGRPPDLWRGHNPDGVRPRSSARDDPHGPSVRERPGVRPGAPASLQVATSTSLAKVGPTPAFVLLRVFDGAPVWLPISDRFSLGGQLVLRVRAAHSPTLQQSRGVSCYWRAMCSLSSASGSSISSPLRSTVTVWSVPVKRYGAL
jgi:hypothetical protein